MKQKFLRNVLLIGCLLGISLFTQIFHSNPYLGQNIKEESPQHAAEWFSKYPDVDKKYFSPYSSPGFMDEIELSFRAQYDVDYSCNMTAMPRVLNIQDVGFMKMLYLNDSGKFGILYQKIDYALPFFNYSLNWILSEDNGTTWSNPRSITPIVQVLETEENDNVYNALSAVYFEGVIHCIYRFGILKMYYFNSTDEGVSWSSPKCIIDGTIPFNTDYSLKFGMAMDPKNKIIHVLTPTGDNKEGTGLYCFNSTNFGDTWSFPMQLNVTKDVDYQECDLFFSSTGTAYFYVMNYSDSNFPIYFIEMIDGLWGSGVYHQIGDYRPLFSACLDLYTDKLTYIYGESSGDVYHEIWKCPSSTPLNPSFYSPMTDSAGIHKHTNLISINDTLFYASLSSYSGIKSIVFEKISEPLNISEDSGFVPEDTDVSIHFNATKNGHPVPYTNFCIRFKAYNLTEFSPFGYYPFITYVYRDDVAPSYTGPNYNQFISPQIIDNSFDSLNYNFSTSEDVEYSYKILSNATNSIFDSTVSASLSVKESPKTVMDETGRIYSFYQVVSGSSNQLFFQVSETGGLTWSEPEALTMSGYSNRYYNVFYSHTSIYVLTQYDPIYNYAILKSDDGGKSWTKIETNSSLIPDYICMTKEGIFYGMMNVDSNTRDAIVQSIDGGKTWDILHQFDRKFSRKTGISVDEVNQRFYFMNQTGTTIDWVSYDMITGQISVKYVADSNYGMNIWRMGHDYRITNANASNGNTSIEFDAYHNATPGDTYGHEVWTSNNNGTTWICIENITLSMVGPPVENYFYASESKTHLRLRIESKDGIDNAILDGESRMVYRNAEYTTRNTIETIDYRGMNFNQQFLAQGEYQIEVVILDQSENRNIMINTFYIDNSAPIINNITWNHIPIDPLPKNNANVTFHVNDFEGHLHTVVLYYRHTSVSWATALLTNLGDEYMVEIPGNINSTRLEFFIQATDLAGNTGVNNNNQSYFGWVDPVINFVVLPLSDERSTYDELPLRVIFTEGASAIDSVFIVTDIGINISLTFVNGSFEGNVPQIFNHNRVSYQIFYQDKWGRTGICYQGTHTKPLINFALLNIPDITTEYTTRNELAFSVSFDENSLRYIQTVKVKFQLDGGDWQESILNNTVGTYRGMIGPFNTTENVSFKLVYVDISGQETLIKESEGSIALIPAMPIVELTEQQTLMLGLISALVGLVLGLGYASALRTQQRDPYITYSDAFKAGLKTQHIQENDKVVRLGISYILDDPIMQYHPKVQSKITLSIVSVLGAVSGYFLYSQFTIQSYEMATVIAVIIFLIVVMVFNIIMDRACDKASRNRKDYGKVVLLGFFFLIIIFGSLALIFWVGSYIKWFNYYIYEERTIIGPLAIPTLWLSVASTYFTSMLYVVITTMSSIKKTWNQLQQYTQNGSNLLDIFLFREKEIHSIKQQIFYKTMVFIVLVSIAVITATNLSTYMNLGLLALVPFIIATLLTILVFGRTSQTKNKGVTVHSIVKCPNCNASVSQGTFCNMCGKNLTLDLTEKVIKSKCPNCSASNEDESYYCRICGTPLKNKPQV